MTSALERLEDSRGVVELEGGLNFRDLGGLVGAGGRPVRHGLVYRSGTMHALTPADHQRLGALGIRVVIDLRSSGERVDWPFAPSEAWPADYWSRDYAHGSGELRLLRMEGVAAGEARQMMVDLYRRLPYDHAESYRELFGRIAAGELPLVFNCAAGKDRTGVAAILLLDTLGVARGDILADYLLTNRLADSLWAHLSERYDTSGDRQQWEPVFTCDQSYAEAMFATVEERNGSLAGYRREVLGLDEAIESAVRERLLEPAPPPG